MPVSHFEKPPGFTEFFVVAGPLRRFLRKYLLSSFLLLASSMIFSLDPLVLRFLIDRGLAMHRKNAIVASVAALLAIYSLRAIFLFAGNIMSAGVAQRFMMAVRLKLFRRLLRSPSWFYERRGVGDLVVLLGGDVEQISSVCMDVIPTLIRSVATGVAILAIMLALHWRLTCIALPAVPLFLLLRMRFRRYMEKSGENTRQVLGDLASFSTEAIRGIFQIELLDADRFFSKKYAKAAVRAVRALLAQRRIEMLYGMASLAIMALVSTAVLGAGASLTWQGQLTIGSFIAFYSYLLRLFEPLGTIVENYARVKISQASLRRIWEVQTGIDTGDTYPKFLELPANSLVCDGVTFGYRDEDIVLHGLNLDVRAGELLAIKGPSGSGKSTLAKLMVGCYEIKGGSIHIDGVDIQQIDIRELRKRIILVPQEGMLFAGSIIENATLGCSSCTMEQIQDFAHAVCFDEVVARFPLGWNHLLGFNGEGLSGGEKQRLMLLRALVRNRPIMILDEATSGLDFDLEQKLMERLSACMQKKVIIAITHREGVAQWADRVIHLGSSDNSGSTVSSCSTFVEQR